MPAPLFASANKLSGWAIHKVPHITILCWMVTVWWPYLWQCNTSSICIWQALSERLLYGSDGLQIFWQMTLQPAAVFWNSIWLWEEQEAGDETSVPFRGSRLSSRKTERGIDKSPHWAESRLAKHKPRYCAKILEWLRPPVRRHGKYFWIHDLNRIEEVCKCIIQYR